MMAELHSQGMSKEKIADCLKKMPLDSHFITAVKSVYSLGCDLRIVSDANMFFIETILEHHGLIRYFSEINTNSCHVDEDGKLRISPYHDFHSSSHDCSLCPPHMCKVITTMLTPVCKLLTSFVLLPPLPNWTIDYIPLQIQGVIIERIQMEASEQGKTTRFIYLGDGSGDYCPSLKLSKTDYVMPREDYPLCQLISNNPLAVKAEVHKWMDAKDQMSVLLKLIKKHRI